jgi:HEAT repeat protein
MNSSVVARTSQPFKWWQSVGILVGFCLLVYGAFAGWQFMRVSSQLDMLKNANAAVRQKAAEALGRSESRRAVEPLIAALNDPDFGVQASAATALGEIKDPRAVQPLVDALKHSKDEKAVCDALGNLGPIALEPLITALKDKNLSYAAESGLAKIGPPAVEPLMAAFNDKGYDVRFYAIRALGEIKDPRAVDLLIAALKYKDKEPFGYDYEIREEAARALGEIKDPRADQPLIAALKDSDDRVVKAAGDALGKIGDPQAVDYLMTALRTHNTDVIAAASSFYIRRGEPGTEDALIEALNKSGDKRLAEDMINSGNEKLSHAANEWASSHNYEIQYMPGSKSTGWGEKQ